MNDDEEENESTELVGIVAHAAVAVTATNNNRGGPRAAAVDRTKQKEMWSLGYATWTDAQFKARVQVSRDTFNFILDEIRPDIEKTPTNLKPNPIQAHRQQVSLRTGWKIWNHFGPFSTWSPEPLFARSTAVRHCFFKLLYLFRSLGISISRGFSSTSLYNSFSFTKSASTNATRKCD